MIRNMTIELGLAGLCYVWIYYGEIQLEIYQ